MGGKSTVDVQVLNTAVASAIVNVSKSCAAEAKNSAGNSAVAVAGNVNVSGNIKQTANASSSYCQQADNVAAAIKSEMANAIKAKSSIQDNNIFSGDLGIFSEALTKSRTENQSILTMDTKSLMTCFATGANTYYNNFGTIGGNLTISVNVDQQVQGRIQECVQSSNIVQDLAQSIINDIDATSKKQGLLAQLADNAGNLVVIIVVAVIFVGFFAIFIAYFKMKANKAKGDEMSKLMAAAVGAVNPNSLGGMSPYGNMPQGYGNMSQGMPYQNMSPGMPYQNMSQGMPYGNMFPGGMFNNPNGR